MSMNLAELTRMPLKDRAALLMGKRAAALYLAGQELASRREHCLRELLMSLKTPEVKELAKETGRSTRGCTTRKDFERVIYAWLAAISYDDSGYTKASGYSVGKRTVPTKLHFVVN